MGSKQRRSPIASPSPIASFTGAHVPILKQALAIYAAEKIDFVDAAVLAIARHNGWHLETFDKALAKLVG